MASSHSSSPKTALHFGMNLSVATPAAMDLASRQTTLAPEASSDSSPTPLQPMLLPLLPIPAKQQEQQLIDYPSLGKFSGANGRTWAGRARIDVNQIPWSSDSEDEDGGEGQPPAFQFSEKLREIKQQPPPMMCTPPALYQETLCEPSPSRASDDEDPVSTRKKLRLSKEQSDLLEESFKQQHTLNTKRKHELAQRLNLRPRQVEVWFQNRRARTKLKQTEVDCELLKRYCEALKKENGRLKKELQELRAMDIMPQHVLANDFYMPLPATALSVCPTCEGVRSMVVATDSSNAVGSAFAALSQHRHSLQQQASSAY